MGSSHGSDLKAGATTVEAAHARSVALPMVGAPLA